MEAVPLTEATAADLLVENASKYPDGAAFFFDDRAYTWREIDRMSDYAAWRMAGEGVEKGTHVGLWSVNHIRLVLYLLAAMKLGAVPVVINYSYRVYELQNVLRRADVTHLYLGESKRGADFADMARAARPACPLLQTVETMEAPRADALSPEGRGLLARARRQVTCRDTACITFTSGTTRVPKPVMLSYFNVVNNARQFTARMRVSRERDDVLLAPLPLFHSSGLTGMLFHSLVTGVPAVLCRMLRAAEALRDLARYRVTVLMAVPSMLELLADHPDRVKFDLSALRVGQSSGASISPTRLLEVVQALGFRHFLMGYGQTECAPLVTTTRYEDPLPRATATAGLPLPHVSLRIWDAARSAMSPPGETGEIQVRGFNTMQGYYNAPAETAARFTADGWLRTTDRGFLDAEGRLHFVARDSELIVRHGENISPAEIEAVVREFCPAIRAVKVVGVPAAVVGEEIACLVEARKAAVDPQALRCYVHGRLASYKVPKYVFSVDELPQTATGKLDHGAAKRLAARLAAEEMLCQEERT